VRTDPAHLRQIVVNLLGNAVKFTDAGGVTVRTRHLPPLAPGTSPASVSGSVQEAALRRQAPDPARAWVVLQVIDTGRGIAPADHGRIFDEFEQVNPGSRGDSDRRGTGLGLPISRRLARLLGGELTVDSAPSRGSTFTLWLPV
jgi:signal transduction histidine kinase